MKSPNSTEIAGMWRDFPQLGGKLLRRKIGRSEWRVP